MTSLLVTIDVEEDMPNWQVQAQTTLRNLQGLPRFHDLCVRLGVRPTYLCTWPVVTRPEGDPLVEWHRRGECEIGAHLHPWTTPPFDTSETRLEAVQPSRLPASWMERKLETLTDALVTRFGVRPESYRAGRFGFNGAGLQAIERLGYRVDSSVTPFVDWRSEGGVDHREGPEVPYFPDRQRPTRRGTSRVLEVPVSIGPTAVLPDFVTRSLVRAPRSLRIPGITQRLTGVGLRWLYPSAATYEEMCALADTSTRRGLPMLNVFFHSNELWPGESPYCLTTEAVDRYLETLERFFGYAMSTLGARPRTLSEFATAYVNG
jgi:hypothetical protein